MGILRIPPFTDVEAVNFNRWFQISEPSERHIFRFMKVTDKNPRWEFSDYGKQLIKFVEDNLVGTAMVTTLNSEGGHAERHRAQYVGAVACNIETDAIALAMFINK